jgi:hypothetical protein
MARFTAANAREMAAKSLAASQKILQISWRDWAVENALVGDTTNQALVA